MLLAALFFLATGTMMLRGPATFWSAGATGAFGSTPTMTVYNKDMVFLLGWIGILISVFLFAVMWRIYRGK